MSKLRETLSVVAINALIFLALLGVLFISPPIVYWAYSLALGPSEADLEGAHADARPRLPNYEKYPWAGKHFEEFAGLETDYHDYVTWRRKDFAGETITIEKGLRRTVVPPTAQEDDIEFHFYGGSTTWGTGSTDPLTYPSMFAAATNLRAVNHGEAGYIARQSLSLLIDDYIRGEHGRRRAIVFYDGVNEVSERCRAEVSTLGSGREMQIRSAVTGKNSVIVARNAVEDPFSWVQTFAQLRKLLAEVSQAAKGGPAAADVFVQQAYSCHRDRARAREVAETLVAEWVIADRLAAAHGDRFVATLQPVAFVGKPQLSHLNLAVANPGLQEQYEAVYPEILAAVHEHPELKFLDLTDVYDGAEHLYIDWCHVSPQGHERLVPRMIQGFKELGVL